MKDLSDQFINLSQTRREALKNTAKIFGGAVSINALAFGLYGCDNSAESDKVVASDKLSKPKTATKLTYSADDVKALDLLSELILPATDTPGASAAKVNLFMVDYSQEVGSEWEQKAIKNVLAHFYKLADDSSKKITEMDTNKLFAELERLDAADARLDKDLATDFNFFKGLVIAGYYTSEIGATKELKYNAIPGGYRPIKLSEVGRAWANPV